MAARGNLHAPKGNLAVILRNKNAFDGNDSNNFTGSEYTSYPSNNEFRKSRGGPKKTVLEVIGNNT